MVEQIPIIAWCKMYMPLNYFTAKFVLALVKNLEQSHSQPAIGLCNFLFGKFLV